MADPTNSDTLMASASNGVRPYGNGTQILVVGVHGTNNGHAQVANVTTAIADKLVGTTSGTVLKDSSFDWSAPQNMPNTAAERHGTAHTLNGPEDRNVAANRLSEHVLGLIDRQYANGTFSRDKPLVINLAGFSHGGNVAIQAVDNITEGLKQRGLNKEAGIHLTTLSTPAYTGPNDQENPNGTARAAAKADGVSLSHTHFAVKGDGVIAAARGYDSYNNNLTKDYVIPGVEINKGIPTNIVGAVQYLRGASDQTNINHGRAQDDAGLMNSIADVVANRFRGLAPAGTRVADASINSPDSGITIASAKTNGFEGTSLEKHAGQVSKTLDGINLGDKNKEDVVAAVLASSGKAGFDPRVDLNLMQSTKSPDVLIAAQGQGPAALRADPVNISSVQQGTAQNVTDSLTKQANTQIAAASIEPLDQNKARSIG